MEVDVEEVSGWLAFVILPGEVVRQPGLDKREEV